MEPRRNTETDGSSGRPVMSDEPNESSAKSVLTEVTTSNKRVLRASIIADEEMDPTLKTEVFFNTTDGSSGRPLMSDEPNESSAKSVLTEVKRSTKRVLHGSIIADEEMDATLKSEVFFNTTDGSSGRPVMSDKPNESSAISVLTEVRRSNKRLLRGSVMADEEMMLLSSLKYSSTRQVETRLDCMRPRSPRLLLARNGIAGCYTLMEVIVMTDNFGKKIEGNGWWTMYHGKLRTGQEVAVKVWPLGAPSAVVEFHEFEAVRAEYKGCCEHLVKVIGYCEGDPQISIYEYMPGGTLQQYLHGELLLHIVQSKSLQHFPGLGFSLQNNDIFLTENWVPKVYFYTAITSSQWYVKAILEDSSNMGNINPTLGFNFPTETIMKIIKWLPIFDANSTSDCSKIRHKCSTVALVDINPKGKRKQPQTIFTQNQGPPYGL
ncbi:unnamed protein product [Sphagnum jensenii]|uniref:Serine-threonine/tyrosine-protein kinase catalytic domain-containing protein n=1 Tax=Sphagnum jensenii TaxID=128206 RepID=A0ABP1BZC2_9BRYO